MMSVQDNHRFGSRKGPPNQPGTETLTVRFDQPVEGLPVNPLTLHRGKEGDINPAGRTLAFKWFKSRTRKGCHFNGCQRSYVGVATIQSLETGRRYCSAKCFNSDTKLLRRSKRSERAKFGNDIIFDSLEKGEKCSKYILGVKPFVDATEWDIVSTNKVYLPSSDDIGHFLRVECQAVTVDGRVAAQATSKESPSVVAFPKPAPQRELRVTNQKQIAQLGLNSNSSVRVLSYNILAEIYANQQIYPYCPMWALSWKVRSMILLREIRAYGADIICLQEVQKDHYEQFFYKEMDSLGYSGVYTAKTRVASKVDGCYTLFRKSKFRLLDSKNLEFNSIAKTMARNNAFTSGNDAVNRLCKDNVAQVLILENLTSQVGQKICVTNTHIFWDPDYSDVKLWQAHMLLQELEPVARDKIPLILCGDFNSMPSEAVVKMIKEKRVNEGAVKDPCAVLPALHTLKHSIDLVSAYESVTGQEPKFTNYTGHYTGTLDYIWVSQNNVVPFQTFLVPEVKALRGDNDTPLPNACFPSDHIALCIDVNILSSPYQQQQYKVAKETNRRRFGGF
mmetsp:Transcript_1622/g.2337  ORF Transcript_1622/g.2337 Transcript_1622/m.2337 type:complete len:562 (+) Transcript_1622:113-1798(+)